MRSLWFGVLACAAMLIACSDDDSSFATRPSDRSSSSAKSSNSSSKSLDSVVGCKTETEDNCEYGELVDDRDGQTYKTVKIGDQWWMAENLNYETANSYCYDGNATNCTKYGRLYIWAAAMDSAGTWTTNGKGCGYNKTCSPTYPVRGVCPEGWHLPTKTEWNTLLTAVGGSSTAGSKLKSTSGWYDNGNGTDAFGFSALPAGTRYNNGNYDDEGEDAFFWSSTEYGNSSAYNMYLFYGDDDVNLCYESSKRLGFSVRCIQDDETVALSSSSETVKSSSSSSVTPKSSSSSEESSSSVVNPGTTGNLTDTRDGQTYKTVKIGDQVWMAENLNYETDSSFCYNNNESNCTKYGRLYRWAAAVGKSESECGYGKTCSLPSGIIQGVCPEGWHLPSRAEWDTLFNAVGGQSTAAEVLKSTSGWESNGNGSDAFGFSALPAGYRYSNGDYDDEGDYAYFWSSTELSSGSAYTMYLIYYGDSAYLSNRSKDYGFSVRCVKD